MKSQLLPHSLALCLLLIAPTLVAAQDAAVIAIYFNTTLTGYFVIGAVAGILVTLVFHGNHDERSVGRDGGRIRLAAEVAAPGLGARSVLPFDCPLAVGAGFAGYWTDFLFGLVIILTMIAHRFSGARVR